MLDNKPEVQKTAIDTLPDVFHKAMEFGDKDIAIGYLEEVLDNLFKVLDDPNSRKNHEPAKKAIAKLIEDIVENGDPGMMILCAILRILAQLYTMWIDIYRVRATGFTHFGRLSASAYFLPPNWFDIAVDVMMN